MKPRITNEQVHAAFFRLCFFLKHKGLLSLDYDADLGGYVIMQSCVDGSDFPAIGHKRRKATEMYDTMQYASDCIKLANQREIEA